MCLSCCDVRIRTARSGGSGVSGRPGHHRRNCQQEPAGDRLRWETDTARRSTGGAEVSSTVPQTRGYRTEGVRSPGTDNRITETDHGPANTTIPTSTMRSFDVWTTAGDIEAGTRGSRENSEDSRNRQRPTTGTGRQWHRIPHSRRKNSELRGHSQPMCYPSRLRQPRLPPSNPKTEDRCFPTPWTFQDQIELSWEAGLLNSAWSYDTNLPAVLMSSRRCGIHPIA